ncbi:MAG: 2-oxo-4-hydroxy-4-carboxy-5-ureidoimidazoline decarboxylase [Saprospiraceae bacterium]
MTLADFNQLPEEDANQALYNCCGSTVWVDAMMDHFPFDRVATIHEQASYYWFDACTEKDWIEAFHQHPKIGNVKALQKKFAATASWASGEQAGVKTATPETLEALAAGNLAYEKKFGYLFIVCATGKSAEEMLQILQARLPNDEREELVVAMNEQHKITTIRLHKLLPS